MKRTLATACALVMISAAPLWAQQSPPTAPSAQSSAPHKPAKKRARKATARPSAQQPAQTMPPLPATLLNSPPVKPTVTMDAGLLTIDAPNSTLTDVLSGIHSATGASIEGISPTERVAVKLGPGNPDQVIAALLRGTPYDYVILGTLGKRDVVTRVLLSPQQSMAEAQPSAPPQPAPQPDEERTAPDEVVPPRSPASNRMEPDQGQQQPPDLQQQPPTQPGEPQATQQQTQQQPDQQQQQAQPQPQQQQQQQDPNAPKTPEQLFKELQQLEQQKQPQTPQQ